MTRRQLLAATTTLAGQATQRPPNIVVILADDQGYGDLGCYGSPYIRTPNIDRMAREGARLTDFYAQPLCGPSRAALMTGSYPARNSLNFNHLPRARTGIHPNEVTIPELLKKAGYATMMIGKWHLGDAREFLPTRNGFDEWFGLPYSNDMWPYHPKVTRTGAENETAKFVRQRAELTGYDGQGQHYPPDWFPPLPLMHNEEVVELNPDQTKLTDRYTAEALRFIDANKSKPFFLYLAHAMPHVPLFPGKDFDGRSLRGRYGDVVEELDAGTGRILARLREHNLENDTLVIYTSDNGPWLPYGIDAGSAGPLRGGKGGVWEGGIRVPAIFRWPGRIPANTVVSAVAATIDFLPTFAAAANVPLPTDRVIDGHDILPLLTGESNKSPHDFFYYFDTALQYTPQQGRPASNSNLLAIRAGRGKLHLNTGEFYDLQSDIGEAHNVASRFPNRVASLRKQAASFLAALRANIRPVGTLPV
ncbi:MAG: sulfatase [Acidobacteria bacterium]|nr:sulfatase [Acidobacteriota bacterium]